MTALSLEIFNDQFRGGSPKSISVDGRRSLIYLIDQIKRDEPELPQALPRMPKRIETEGSPSSNSQPTRRAPMEYGEVRTWQLFYTAIFDTRKTAMADMIDPSGVVRSQVIESAGGGLRLILNGCRQQPDLGGRFITESFGSGVQHFALATDDIFATAKILRNNGFAEARFGLEPELTDQLRGENILYDRGEFGEFLQFYAPPFGEGFLIEIVERRGPYKGYGAANVPVRIAAQKQHLRSTSLTHL